MGRIGTLLGTTNRKYYEHVSQAQSEFERIYLEKTGNTFGAEFFSKKTGLYYHINIYNEVQKKENRNPQTNMPATKLSQPLYELMELLYNDNQVFKSTLLSICFDLDSMFPLGKLDKAQIQSALKILDEISSMQKSENVNRIIAASNQFYSYFPHNFGFHRPPVINTPKMVQEKLDMLQHILQMELQYEFLISESNQEKNLLDLCYEHLEESTEITVLNKASKMYSEICKYIKNTQLPDSDYIYEFDEVFEVQRHEELLRYAPHEKNFNRILLFHGTPIQNLVSILKNGLKLPLPEFHSGCWKGIYFSDSVSCSEGICRSTNGTKLILLCEVAVGMIDARYKYDPSKLKEHCESVQRVGKFYSHPIHVRPDGLKIPNGMLIPRNEFVAPFFNEFVVSDESRVKIRYLVKLKSKKSDHPYFLSSVSNALEIL